MSGATGMDRGVFHAIQDKQQIDKYDCVNNYRIFLHSHAQVGFVAGTSDHNNFRIEIPPNGTEHIKRAKVRVKFIALPQNSGTRDGSSAFYFVGVGGISKNVYGPRLPAVAGDNSNPGAVRRTDIITAFHSKPLQSIANDTVTVLPIFTTPGRALHDGTMAGATDEHTGSVFDSQGNAQANQENQLAISNVQRLQYTHTDQVYTNMGCMGVGFDTDFVMCDNPFGKTLTVRYLTNKGQDLNFGNSIHDETCLGLEIQLLPDNQANDRFSY